jgi:hypothetical protein
MNIEQLKAARDAYMRLFRDEGVFFNAPHHEYARVCRKHREVFQTLLDNAINAPDLEVLKREVQDELFPATDGEIYIIGKVIDHLAPRIVREGFVVVPEEPTDEMILARNLHSGWSFESERENYKAMIAASKGD